ncbi:hypothetical protein GCM10008921_19810 [Metaclostridioides mangenotii]
MKSLNEIFSLSNEEQYVFELEMRNCLCSLWLNLVREVKEEIKDAEPTVPVPYDEERVKLSI